MPETTLETPVTPSIAATTQKSSTLPGSRSVNTVCRSTDTIACVTQPMTIELTSAAMYTARRPRRNAAGLPA